MDTEGKCFFPMKKDGFFKDSDQGKEQEILSEKKGHIGVRE